MLTTRRTIKWNYFFALICLSFISTLYFLCMPTIISMINHYFTLVERHFFTAFYLFWMTARKSFSNHTLTIFFPDIILANTYLFMSTLQSLFNLCKTFRICRFLITLLLQYRRSTRRTIKLNHFFAILRNIFITTFYILWVPTIISIINHCFTYVQRHFFTAFYLFLMTTKKIFLNLSLTLLFLDFTWAKT